jgi:hypothetical protein
MTIVEQGNFRGQEDSSKQKKGNFDAITLKLPSKTMDFF